MGEAHFAMKFAVPYLDPGGDNRGCLRLAGRALAVNQGQIEFGYVDVTDYCHMIKNNRITVFDPIQNLAGFNYGKMRLFSYFIASRIADRLRVIILIVGVQISNDYIFLLSTLTTPGGTLVEGLSHNG
jgi:hypothetical protein